MARPSATPYQQTASSDMFVPLNGQMTIDTAASLPYIFQVKELTLSNGLTVWINEDHTQPKVYGAVVVKAGARDCPNTGIAHYFEHILFKGTDKIGTVDYAGERPWLDSIEACYDRLAQTIDENSRRAIQKDINRLSVKAALYAIPNEFNNLISRYGGTGLNAYTSLDETVFYNTFSPQYIAQWAELNSERMLHPVFRLFQGELETVYEEKNMHSDNMLMQALEAV
ncbi:MAG: insulinase family protein [Prevotella sp.]|nr:insulinase family protein [Prevotella sp.]MDO4933839.1 insulinase family protein [Prevotella sp.]